MFSKRDTVNNNIITLLHICAVLNMRIEAIILFFLTNHIVSGSYSGANESSGLLGSQKRKSFLGYSSSIFFDIYTLVSG